MSIADAATALLNNSLMPPQLQEDPSPPGLGTATHSPATNNVDSHVLELPEDTSDLSLVVGPSTIELPEVEHTDRRRPERDLAGENAILLAKTQATAAWVQSETLWRQMRELEGHLADEQDQAERSASELAAIRRELEAERHERTAAQAASDELRRYLDQQQGHLGFLRDRIVSLESERDTQQSCLGWIGRRRLRRLLQQRWEADPRSALPADRSQPSIGNPLTVSEDPPSQPFD